MKESPEKKSFSDVLRECRVRKHRGTLEGAHKAEVEEMTLKLNRLQVQLRRAVSEEISKLGVELGIDACHITKLQDAVAATVVK